ncbi:heat-inducible transcriptional repressor HrcA [Intestinibacillus massiliensis]|uniref:heat-inducible transcriptional repressor HrcA n=1 Tax=Intestinibacillus massiliensis TaxID=1871029 RepID=UPI000B3606E5|nr:heat-inducible transcriptional repressor HrcA [Intestinibacillus massiliensis]MCB6365224.1 heat-inducible transcriptional repressor HrcA [Intestinibacillus massiliensis]
MELSDRKKQILKAIIGDYIRTAEPVGSKTIAQRPGITFSPATIRNEMSELEELGYLEKPHTSAGRIPSPLGYRLYVDELMAPTSEPEPGDDAGLRQMMQLKVRELDKLIQEAGKLIANLTEYTAVAATPVMQRTSLKQFEIIAVNQNMFVIVVVTESGAVKNKMVHTAAPVSKDEAELLTYVLNQTLTGIPLSSITTERFDIVRRAAGLTALLAPVAEYIAELIEETGRQEVYLEGAGKLLRYPEYRDTQKAQAVLDYLGSDRSHLIPVGGETDGVQIMIGPENGENPLSDASMIYARYSIGDFGQGVIGIVGPTRMDYARLSARLSRFAKGLNKLIAETFLEEHP